MNADQGGRTKGAAQLLSILGLGFGLAGAVGGSIGAGILRTPGLVAAQLGSPPLVMAAWALGGLYVLMGAIAVAELGAALPSTGGWTVYARRALGDQAGFAVGWIDWLGHCAGLAWVAVTIGEVVSDLLPATWQAQLPLGEQGIAVAVLVLLALIQRLGLRAAGTSQNVLSLAKALAFLGLIVACFTLQPDPTRLASLPTAVLPTASAAGLAIGVVLALQAVITTYDGWHSPLYFAEEFEAPERDLPRSLIGGVLAVLALYGLINLAMLRVLPVPQLAASNLAVADAAAVLFGAAGRQGITVLALVSLVGLINASIMAAPRVLYGLARDGMITPGLARVNAGGTPSTALLLTTLASAALVLTGSFSLLLGMAAFLYVALYLSGFSALLSLRWREPDAARPYRAWGSPWSVLVVLAGSLAFLLGALISDPGGSLGALALIAASLPLRPWLGGATQESPP